MFKLLFIAVIAVSVICTAAVPGPPRKPKGRIVGGVAADIRHFPYQITINKYGYWHSCGGSIIAPRTILTAAHCVPTGDTTDLSIRAGSAKSGEGGQLIDIIKIIVHPGYDRTRNNINDIAVMHLAKDLVYDDSVQAIPLCKETPQEGAVADISGWGALQENGASPDELQRTQVRVLTNKKCNEMYSGRISEKMVCAAAPKRDACQGDSGGPMAVNKCLSGVVSWGFGCAREESPGVYTDVSKYLSWINSNMA